MSARVPHVLIVDDDASLRGMYSEYLKGSGLEVTQAPTGRRGLEAARHFHPDVVVTDFSMPEMDGGELSRRLREDRRTWDIPIIAVSGDDRRVRTGADVVLAKPCEPDRLLHAIEDMLGRGHDDH